LSKIIKIKNKDRIIKRFKNLQTLAYSLVFAQQGPLVPLKMERLNVSALAEMYQKIWSATRTN
jgi:hypothetical protein